MQEPQCLVFGPFRLDRRDERLWRGPEVIPLPPKTFASIFKFFQVDSTGIVRRTSCVRYCKEGVGSRRPKWRWLMCFLELPKAQTSCKAFVKRLTR
jgi:hypothetical protein